MSNLQLLRSDTHAQIRICDQTLRISFGQLVMVPVVLSEFLKLCIHYPIVLAKAGDTGQFGCSALMGLKAGHNLLFDDPQWQPSYLPAQLRCQPLLLAPTQQPDEFQVCIDTAHPAVNQSRGSPLYEAGAEAEFLRTAKLALAELAQGQQATGEFVDQLQTLDLLVPLQLALRADGERTTVNGLYSVDQQKLEALTDDQLLQLQRRGYLHWIYTLLASQSQIYPLVNRHLQRSGH